MLQLFSPVSTPQPTPLGFDSGSEDSSGVEHANARADAPSEVLDAVRTAQLRVRGDGATDRGSIVKTGVFTSRYGNLGNPIAYGIDYNVDTSRDSQPARGENMSGNLNKQRRERLGAFGADVNGPRVGSSIPYRTIEDPIAAPPARHMIFTEKNNAAAVGTVNTGAPFLERLLKPAADAYQTYGYQEKTDWQNPGARAGAERARAEHTRVMDFDTSLCAPGQEIVNGQCFSSGHGEVTCPAGYALDNSGECKRTPSLQPH